MEVPLKVAWAHGMETVRGCGLRAPLVVNQHVVDARRDRHHHGPKYHEYRCQKKVQRYYSAWRDHRVDSCNSLLRERCVFGPSATGRLRRLVVVLELGGVDLVLLLLGFSFVFLAKDGSDVFQRQVGHVGQLGERCWVELGTNWS